LPIIFGWACPFSITSIFSICESVCYFHQFRHRFRLCSSQFFNEIWMAKTRCKGIYCSLVGDVFYRVFLLYSILVCMNIMLRPFSAYRIWLLLLMLVVCTLNGNFSWIDFLTHPSFR
jgi:hypothetical protein